MILHAPILCIVHFAPMFWHCPLYRSLDQTKDTFFSPFCLGKKASRLRKGQKVFYRLTTSPPRWKSKDQNCIEGLSSSRSSEFRVRLAVRSQCREPSMFAIVQTEFDTGLGLTQNISDSRNEKKLNKGLHFWCEVLICTSRSKLSKIAENICRVPQFLKQ